MVKAWLRFAECTIRKAPPSNSGMKQGFEITRSEPDFVVENLFTLPAWQAEHASTNIVQPVQLLT